MKRLLTISILAAALASTAFAAGKPNPTDAGSNVPQVLVVKSASSFAMGIGNVAAFLMQGLIGSPDVPFQGINVKPNGAIEINFGAALTKSQLDNVKEAAASLAKLANKEAKTNVLTFVSGKGDALFYLYAVSPTEGDDAVSKIAARLVGAQIILEQVPLDPKDAVAEKLMKDKLDSVKKAAVADAKLPG